MKAKSNRAKGKKAGRRPDPAVLAGRRRAFIAEYLVDRNQTRAAIRAGYSPKTAKEQASRLMADPAIAAEIEASIEAQEARTQITADRVLQELGRIAFVDFRGAYDAQGRLLNPRAMPEDLARAIAAIDVEEMFAGSGEDRMYIGDSKKLKLCDKVKALELLGKHFKMFTDRVEHDVSESLGAALKAARARIGTVPAEPAEPPKEVA